MKWVCAGVEIEGSRRQTWVARCGVAKLTGRVRVEVAPLDGTAVAPQLVAMWEQLDLDGFALDPRSPAATLIEPLRAEGMTVRLPDAAGVATAHGMFADLLRADRLRAGGDPALDEAVRAAEARRLAGQDAVQRYAAVEMAPLLAAELSVWMLGDPETAEGITPGVWVLEDGPGRRPAPSGGRADWESWPGGIPPWVQRG